MRGKLFPICLIIAVVVFASCTKRFSISRAEINTSEEWPYPRKDIRASAAVTSNFGGQLNLIWEKKNSETPIGPLTIGAGKLIYCGGRSRIYFYDLATGDYLGVYKAGFGVQSGVVVSDSMAYFGVGPTRNQLICLNLLNRKVSWALNIKDVTGTPIIIDNRLYAGSSDGKLICLNKKTGVELWQYPADGRCLAGPSGDGNMVFFPQDNGLLLGLKAATGDKIFEVELDQPLVTKAVIGDKVYITGSEGGFFALDKSSGSIVWEKTFSYPIWTSPALDNGVLYFGDNGGNLMALTEKDGETQWQFQADGVIVSSPIVVGDYLLFASLDRNLYCLNKNTGELVSKREFKRGIDFPAVSDGRVVCVAAHDGTIQCFGD
ncbi:MAG: PQQ-binding-like beta-propeller repeat protein [Candidatus Zixiibacteriota bacterium]